MEKAFENFGKNIRVKKIEEHLLVCEEMTKYFRSVTISAGRLPAPGLNDTLSSFTMPCAVAFTMSVPLVNVQSAALLNSPLTLTVPALITFCIIDRL